ncbi:MAG: ATP-binding protein [bacterium]|nr:ATP-binding protein [bacterium]
MTTHVKNEGKVGTYQDLSRYAEAIVDTLQQPLLIIGDGMKVLFANEAFYRKFLVSAEDTIDHEIYSLGSGQWKIPALRLLLEEIIPHRTALSNYEIRREFPRMGMRTMLLNARKLNSDDHPRVILLVIEDITDRVKATADLMESKAKDDALLASIGDGVIAADIDGKIIHMNPAAETMLGWRRDEVIGKVFDEVVPTEDIKQRRMIGMDLPVSIALKNGKATMIAATAHSSAYYVRKDGTRFPVTITATPIHLDKKISKKGDERIFEDRNALIGAIVVFRDVTEERKLDQAKDEFVSIASHQLRTPLIAIKGYTDMLRDEEPGPLNDAQKKCLADVKIANDRMIALINSLLNVSRIDLGMLSIQPVPTDFKGVAESVLGEIMVDEKSKGLDIRATYDPTLPLINADPKLIRMVFQNLLTNAVKYTRTSGSIALDIKRQGVDVLITVSDTGCGIPKSEQEKIFTKMFRADNARTVDPDGSGMGLYIIKAIIEAAGGKIWFASEENKGTIFSVTLPLEGMKNNDGSKELQ